MCELFGKKWKKDELLRQIGDISQVADIRLAELSDGPGRGVRLAEFKTGSGFNFTVLLDRGLDIHDAAYQGVPLAFQSGSGIRHPAHYEPENAGWLRNFHGGWLNTCGFSNVGPPGKDELGQYEMHGRASNLQANLIGYGGKWRGDDYELWLEASIRETSFFGYDISLTRRFSTRLGNNYVQIVDKIENLGEREAPFMLLYHCNFGFPLVAEGSQLILCQKSVRPRDEAAKIGLDDRLVMQSPQAGFAEQVYFYDLHADSKGFATAAIANEDLDLAGFVSFRKKELNNFIEWKQMGLKEYVLGLEPANCLVLGREAERQQGNLRVLKPGETQESVLFLGVASGKTAVSSLTSKIQNRELVFSP